MTLNKADLMAAVQADTALGARQAKAFVDAFFAAVGEGLVADAAVALYRFGTFELAERPAKKVRNVAAGQPLLLAARQAVRFRPAKALRARVSARWPRVNPR